MAEPTTSKRGRPVSTSSRANALRVAAQLLAERGWPGFSIDEVARRSTVGKATIYRHWAGSFPLAVEAWAEVVTAAVPTVGTGELLADLTDQMERLAEFYASPRGHVAAQLIGAAPGQPGGTELIGAVFFAPRRDATRALIREGISGGQLRSGIDPDAVIDLIFGPIIFRLLNGMGPIRQEGARELAALARMGIAP